MKKKHLFLAIVAVFLLVSMNISAANAKFDKDTFRNAAHAAVQKDCQCDIKEWLKKTFDYVHVEGNDYEMLEVFSSRRSTDIFASDLAAYIKLRFDPATGKYTTVEVDYYSPRTCRNYNY